MFNRQTKLLPTNMNFSNSCNLSKDFEETEALKYRRRSSLFKPNESATVTVAQSNDYPVDYEKKLSEELEQWHKELAQVKFELKEERTKHKKLSKKVDVKKCSNKDPLKEYIKLANQFCEQVNTAFELQAQAEQMQYDELKSKIDGANELLMFKLTQEKPIDCITI